MSKYVIKKLTSREYWRLMAYSDAAYDKAKAAGISDTQLYKQAGNSIACNVLYCIFKFLFHNKYQGDNADTLTVNELFSGIGSQRAALDALKLNHKVIGISEIDPYAIKAYNAIFGETRNYGDISVIDKLDYADFWTYSFPCFVGNTLVLTKERGYVPIKDINIGDTVLTHSNTYKKVTRSMCTGQKKIVEILAMCFDKIECTENHKFFVRHRHRVNTHKEGKSVNYRYFDAPEWVEAKDLTKDLYLGYAINQNAIVPEWNGIDLEWADGRTTRHKNELSAVIANEAFWWIVGRYIADGYQRSQGGIVISCGKAKVEQIEPYLDACKFNYNRVEERTSYKYHIGKKEIGLFMQQFGNKAYGKFIPAFVIDMPVNLCKAFLDGYMSGDGCFTQGIYKASSVSRELLYGIGQLIAKVYHRPFSLYYTKRKAITEIEGRTVNQRDSYNITYRTETRKQDKAFYEDGYIWFPINEVTLTDRVEPVYDITVEEDHSFTANGAIVHNCTDISVAGTMDGIIKGKTRSGLLYEVQRLLDKAKVVNELPKYLMLENVKNLVGSFKPQFDDWLSYLDSLGYNTYWQVLNAKDYGIPQNRERVFAISIRKDIDDHTFRFPPAFDNGTRICDFLEKDINEKYIFTTPTAEQVVADIVKAYNLPQNDGIVTSGQPKEIELSHITKKANEIKTLGLLPTSSGKIHQQSRVIDIGGISPTFAARDYKDPVRVLIEIKDKDKV